MLALNTWPDITSHACYFVVRHFWAKPMQEVKMK